MYSHKSIPISVKGKLTRVVYFSYKTTSYLALIEFYFIHLLHFYNQVINSKYIKFNLHGIIQFKLYVIKFHNYFWLGFSYSLTISRLMINTHTIKIWLFRKKYT